MLDRDAAIERRDELQIQYNQANNQARELAGAVAAYDEVIATFDAPAEIPTTDPTL